MSPDVHRATALALLIGGALTAAAGFITLNTQLVLAYRGGTLANVHTLCGSPLVQALGGAARCSAINSYYTLATVALYGGLLLAAAGLVLLVMFLSAQPRKATP